MKTVNQPNNNDLILYILYGISFFSIFFCAPLFIAIGVVSFVFRDGNDELYNSHYRFLVRISLLVCILGLISFMLMIILIGFFMYFILVVWVVFKLVYGLKYLANGQAYPGYNIVLDINNMKF